jgi:hypothetical protein
MEPVGALARYGRNRVLRAAGERMAFLGVYVPMRARRLCAASPGNRDGACSFVRSPTGYRRRKRPNAGCRPHPLERNRQHLASGHLIVAPYNS